MTRTSSLRPLAAIAALAVALVACETVEKADPQPMPVRAEGFDIQTPPILNGTVMSQSVVVGNRPVLVRGYGLVVNLKGTGSRDLPPDLRAFMLNEMSKRGIGRDPLGQTPSPQALLDSPDTAVVIVEAVIPAGATKGTRFDVRCVADPRTGTTNLDGGTLYTCDLRPPTQGELLPRTGQNTSFAIGAAHGPIFINPFVEPGSANINTTTGRVLDGGVVTRDIPIKLRLGRPSHNLARVIQRAINTRFPEEYDERNGEWIQVARGESDESITIRVPPSYRDRSEEFIQLVQHTTIRLIGAESIAMSVRRYVQSEPGTANSASWRWQALGSKSLPIIRDLYDDPNDLIRLAALRAGAGLDDALVVPSLVDMAASAGESYRREAMRLLSHMGNHLAIDRALREHLSDPDIETRLVAYEALAERGDPWMERHNVEGKFFLDVVESESPLIYITQLRQPRIVVFGNNLSLDRPLTVNAWSNRLLVKEAQKDGLVEVYYRPEGLSNALVEEIPADLGQFIQHLGRSQASIETAEPGLGMSYSETVGAVYQIWKSRAIAADFKAEQDRILAAIRDFEENQVGSERPEFSDPDYDGIYPEASGPGETLDSASSASAATIGSE